ncbi:aspartate dehydrogenase [Roseovarius nanhaiticus]|uniref:aspartate dehydrogenase n=1 Tax=Roseovarius nanhaiticus TaxID=573024 RepID=UPI002492A6BD|nr:aspartate dehydrogenase [Roseovarius nanhaiticus]
MPRIGLIGYGAIASYVACALKEDGMAPACVLARHGREAAAEAATGATSVTDTAQMATRADIIIDCAGHAGLTMHGPALLAAGRDLITLSLGALADAGLQSTLEAAPKGGGRLHLASGAIGALDALSAARVGGLEMVRYTGIKPPGGWVGSPAEEVLDLVALKVAAPHFTGTARAAALAYPKNANVAAAVALAGIGFDATEVQLIADPAATQNTHRIEARGAFGQFDFVISGNALPDNPRSSALAAMSAVSALRRQTGWLRI